MKGRLCLMQVQFGLTVIGLGEAEHTFTFVAIGKGQGQAVYGSVAPGNMARAATGGIEVIGGNKVGSYK